MADPGVFPPDMLCDTVTNALAAVGVEVGCREDRLTRRIEVFDPTGRGWDEASLEICYTPRIPAMPAITDFNPKEGDELTRIVIDGCGFPSDPKDVCVSILLPDSARSIPLQVVEADPTRLVAIPPVCPWWEGEFGGRIQIAVGRGVRGDVKPVADKPVDWTPDGPAWAWSGDLGVAAISPVDYVLTMGPMPGVTIIGSDEPTAGRLDVDIQIPPWANFGCRVTIGAIVFDDIARAGYCLSTSGIQRGSDFGEDLCGVITSSFEQLFGVDVSCEEAEDATGRSIVRVSLPGGQITRGVVVLGLEELPVSAPVITDFNPKEGPPGTEVTIRGRNFLPAPDLDLDDLLVSLQSPETGQLIPLHVLEATDTEIRAVVGIAVVAGKPVDIGPIWLTIGEGISDFLKPIPEVGQPGPTWTWALSPTLPLPPPKTVSGEGFQLRSAEPPEDTAWFVSGPPRNGELVLFLQDDWQADSRVEISIDLRDNARNRSYSLYSPLIVFQNGGRADSAAGQLCRFVEQAFAQRGIDVQCEVASGRANVASVVLRLPDGSIDEGGISVSVSPRPVEHVQPVITDIGPSEGGPGDVITIQGSGFGDDPAGVSVNVVSGADAIPLDVVDVSDTMIMARVGAVNPLFVKPVEPFPKPVKPGPIRVIRGVGQVIDAKPTPKITPLSPTRIFQRKGGLAFVSGQVFLPTTFTKPVDFLKPVDKPVGPLVNEVEKGVDPPVDPIGCFFGGVDDGRLCLTLGGDWPTDVEVRLRFRAHNSSQLVGTEVESARGRLPGGPLLDCAQRISDFIRRRLMMYTDTDVEIEIIENADGTVKLAASLPGGVPIEWGVFDLCILASGPPGGIRGGDCNADGMVDITDAICLLGFMFLGNPMALPCGDAGEPEPDPDDVRLLDWNGDGGTPDISDVIAMLSHLFLGTAPHALGRGCLEIPGCPERCNL